MLTIGCYRPKVLFGSSDCPSCPQTQACIQYQKVLLSCKSDSGLGNLAQGCSRDYWKEQAIVDLKVSGDYFDLGRGARIRYIEVVSRWFALPGSELTFDVGVVQLFACRDQDTCTLSHLESFPKYGWSNGIIGAALSGNQAFFFWILNNKFLLAIENGVEQLYDTYGELFESRLKRAAAVGGSFEIVNYTQSQDWKGVLIGGHLELYKKLAPKDVDVVTAFKLAFESGNEDLVNYLISQYKIDLSQFASEAASTGNVDLLSLTGPLKISDLVSGYAKAGFYQELKEVVDEYRKTDTIDPQVWTRALLASCQSLSPLRYEVAKYCLDQGAEINKEVIKSAVLTGDTDLVDLVSSNLDEEYFPFAVASGSLTLVRKFNPSPTMSDLAEDLGFEKVAYILAKT